MSNPHGYQDTLGFAGTRDGVLTAPLARRIRVAVGVIRLIENDRKGDLTLFDSEGLPGQYTWKLDHALPGRHTLRLYGGFTSKLASTLIRAKYCRPNQYPSRIGIVEESKCRYAIDDETFRHVLHVCQSWTVQRRTLQVIDGATYLLGGWESVRTKI